MDDRVANLLDSFPQIFEAKVPPLADFDDEFVIINVPVLRGSKSDDLISADNPRLDSDDVLRDAEYWEVERDQFLEAHPWEWLGRRFNGEDPGSLSYRIRRRVKGTFPGSPGGGPPPPLGNFTPPPDALAFYLPFHRYPDYWGIYLIDAGVRSLSAALDSALRSQRRAPFTWSEARTIAATYLYHHEAYHSAVEAFAVRAELPMRRPLYRTGLRKLYTRGWVPGSPHEETLASAYGLRKVRDNLKMPKAKRLAAMDALKDYLRLCSPEYAAGANFDDDEEFATLEQKFKESAINETLPSKTILKPEAWQLGTYLMAPLIQRNRKYSWICERSDFRNRSKLAIHYFRRRDVIRCLSKLANAREEVGRRHLHLVREADNNGKMKTRRTQVPSGEIPVGTLSQMLKDLELGLKPRDFRSRCREVGEALS